MRKKIVAVGLLTNDDLDRLGANFRRVWKINEVPCFAGLLSAIDDADRQIRREGDSEKVSTNK